MPSSYNPIKEKEYKDHEVFSMLDKMINFYKLLSISIFGFLSRGVEGLAGIDTYMFSSVQGTLESIKTILQNGRINDAYALLRKYYDSVIINVYSNLFLNDNFSIDNFVVKKINDWSKGEETLPEYRVMSEYIKTSKQLEQINKILHKDNAYKKIRKRCNDHSHYRFHLHALLNDNEVFLRDRIAILNSFSEDIEKLFILHLSYLLFLSDHYMASSDYIDAIEIGISPEPGSQYVATFIQEAFSYFIEKNNKDLASLIKSNTLMKLA